MAIFASKPEHTEAANCKQMIEDTKNIVVKSTSYKKYKEWWGTVQRHKCNRVEKFRMNKGKKRITKKWRRHDGWAGMSFGNVSHHILTPNVKCNWNKFNVHLFAGDGVRRQINRKAIPGDQTKIFGYNPGQSTMTRRLHSRYNRSLVSFSS